MSFFEDNQTRFLKWAIRFIRLLMLFTLIATFEHCYTTLALFSADHYLWGIPVSKWAKALFVLVIDFGLYLGEYFIPQFSIRGIKIGLVQSMVFIFAGISVFLNVKYMIEFMPAVTWFNYAIAISVGTLIPVVLAILGFIEGRIQMYKFQQENKPEVPVEPEKPKAKRSRKGNNKQKQLEILDMAENHSQSDIARKMKVSQATVSRIINKG
jgi:hypothetical protein